MDFLGHSPICGDCGASLLNDAEGPCALCSGYVSWQATAEALVSQHAGAVSLDAETLADLDKRAAIHKTDCAGYLRWVLTGKEPATTQGGSSART